MAVSDDAFLDGRLRVLQPEEGFRSGSDAVLLAAAVPVKAGEAVLELGCGAGAAALCLLRRVEGVSASGLETQPALAALARENAARNGLELEVVEGDVGAPPASLRRRSFDHVLMNPPFYERGRVSPAPEAGRRQGRLEGAGGLAPWLACALRRARPGGTITVIHRADRLPALLDGLGAQAGRIVVFPLWPARGEPAGRIVVRAVKSARTPLTLAAGLVLHESDGRYTPEAEAVLRDGAALAFP